jgi:hypothetical protein
MQSHLLSTPSRTNSSFASSPSSCQLAPKAASLFSCSASASTSSVDQTGCLPGYSERTTPTQGRSLRHSPLAVLFMRLSSTSWPFAPPSASSWPSTVATASSLVPCATGVSKLPSFLQQFRLPPPTLSAATSSANLPLRLSPVSPPQHSLLNPPSSKPLSSGSSPRLFLPLTTPSRFESYGPSLRD